jgi:hypothetical protein
MGESKARRARQKKLAAFVIRRSTRPTALLRVLSHEFGERDADKKGKDGEGIKTVGHGPLLRKITHPAALLEHPI